EAPGVTLPEPNPATLEILSDRIAGYDGCNWYRGDYASTGDRLVWSGLVVTVRGCEPEWMSLEEIFLERVREAVAWRVSGDQLELRNASGALRL
ncbi:MAG TPA: META domain-containing protein, partial [Anaerolineales bacterium]|nr:META domain-containing protein [Anaerolineales bacterium]